MAVRVAKGGRLLDEGRDVSGQLISYLCDPCEFESGLVFKDLLVLVEPYAEQLSYLLTSGPWLKGIVEEGKKPFVRDSDEVAHLEVLRYSELNNYGGKDEVSEYTTIHGVGEGGPYALDFSPINTLTELEVRLNEEVSVYDWRGWRSKTEQLAKDGPPVLFRASKCLTLLEVLRGVFWELSFHGSAESRDTRAASLKDTMGRIERGEEKLIPWEEVKAHLLSDGCEKCQGEGWLWWHELDNYAGPATETGQDDTRYTCDKCYGSGIRKNDAISDIDVDSK